MSAGRVEEVTIDGLSVNLRRWEPVRNGDHSASPMVLVHGLGANVVSWLPVGQLLADRRGAPVTALDLVGFGYTRSTGTTATVNRNADLVVAALEQFGPAVVAGNSMGGSITIKVAARRPDLVEAMVLVNPALKPANLRSPQWRNTAVMTPMVIPPLGERLVSARARQLGAAALVDGTLEIVLERPDNLDPTVRDEFITIASARTEYPEAARAYADAASSLFWYLARNLERDLALALASVPGLMIFGDHDRLVDISSARAVADRHPDLDVALLAGIGHAPQLEAPALFVDTVEQWLQNLPSM